MYLVEVVQDFFFFKSLNELYMCSLCHKHSLPGADADCVPGKQDGHSMHFLSGGPEAG